MSISPPAKPLRILLVIPTLDRSGAEKQFTLLATGLPRDQFEVQVVALTRGGPYEAELKLAGIPVTVLHKKGKFDPLCLWRLWRLIVQWKPDVIHSWLFAANAYCRLVAGGKSGPPVIVSERCVDTWKAGWQKWLDRRLISRTARLVGNSQSVAEFYRGLGVPVDKLRVIPNAVDPPQRSGITSAERDRLRQIRWRIPPAAFVLGYVGRLARQKRVDDLLWAMVLLNSLRSDCYMVLIGDGPERERQWRSAHELDLENRVIFSGHREDAAELLPLFDAFCLASDFEGMSNSLMEAMAQGLPVLVSDIPANRELVSHGETGLVIPVGDRAAYARAALRLLEHPEEARQLGDAARLRMQTEFSREKMVTDYAALYREVADGRPGR